MANPFHLVKGQNAEQTACRYLQQHGLRLIKRNYRTRVGEIDLIMQDGEDLVFVEVRYRKDLTFMRAAETIHASKQRRLCNTAALYLQRYHPEQCLCRFDVVTIEGEDNHIEWIKNAFTL